MRRTPFVALAAASALIAGAALTSASDATAKPRVVIVNPAKSTAVGGMVPIRLRAGGGKISRVIVRVDGRVHRTLRKRPFSTAWNTHRVGNGVHTVRVTAVDRRGRRATTQRRVRINQRLAAGRPRVSITSPKAGARVRGDVVVRPAVRSRAGIRRVEFLIDGRRRTTVTRSPYRWTWKTASDKPGRHRLVVRAVDRAGRVRSVERTVTVLAPIRRPAPAPPPSGGSPDPGTGGRLPLPAITAPDPPLPPPTRFVATTGSDAGSCSVAAPCQTLERAYRVASPGEVVQVAAGSYPKQFLTNDPSKTGQAWVVFRPAPGAAVNIAYFDVDGTDSVEFRDMTANGYYVRTGSDRVTFRNIRSSGNGHYVTGASNVSILGGELHSIDSVDGLQVKSREGVDTTNLLIEGLTIRNVTRNRDPQAHTECIQFTSGIRVIIRNSRFVDCSTQGVFFKEAIGGTIREVLVENSWFGKITGYNTLIFDDGVSDATARYNSFAQAPRLGHATTRNIAVYANAGVLASCVSGTTYWRNVWTDAKCASTDLRADPRFLNLNGFDLRLSQGSPAVDRGDPSAHPAGDAFGRARPQGAAPDAGSHELR